MLKRKSKKIMNLFENVQIDPEKFRKEMAEKVGARRTYCIFFTPRSGSSWLAEVLASYNKIGKPEEYFNPNFVPNIANRINADNIGNYVKMAKRHLQTGGYFGFEITYYQLLKTMGEEDFNKFFPADMKSFYLYREDIVLQAVSLAKAVKTSVFHSASASDEQIEKSDLGFVYNGDDIANWLEHIFDQEKKFEKFFKMYDYTPQRISYERITSAGKVNVLNFFLKNLGMPLEEFAESQGRHRKIGTYQNQELAIRFREEHASKMEKINEVRQKYISNIVSIDQFVA